MDDAFDPLFGDDPGFFTNIHANSRCLALIAAWEMAALAGIGASGSSPRRQ